MIGNQLNQIKLHDGQIYPLIGLGMYTLKKEKDLETAIRSALDSGYRLFDTAVMYDNERQMGKVLKKLEIKRQEILITSKILPEDLTYEKTLKSVQNTLKDLQTEYVDLMLLHWPGASSIQNRIGAYRALEECYDKGYLRGIGVSNFLPRHIESLQYRIKPLINQIEIHPLYIENETIEWCKKENIVLQAYSPLAIGDTQLLQREVAKRLAVKYGKTAAQILLRWGVQNDWIVLPRSRQPEHIAENIKIFDFQLTLQEMAEISALQCGQKTDWNPQSVQ